MSVSQELSRMLTTSLGVTRLVLKDEDWERLRLELLAIQRFDANGPVGVEALTARIEYLGVEVISEQRYEAMLREVQG